jgi:hypothetical protein
MSEPNKNIYFEEKDDEDDILTFPDDYFYYSQCCEIYRKIEIPCVNLNFEQSDR